jgi:hypothetical protein
MVLPAKYEGLHTDALFTGVPGIVPSCSAFIDRWHWFMPAEGAERLDRRVGTQRIGGFTNPTYCDGHHIRTAAALRVESDLSVKTSPFRVGRQSEALGKRASKTQGNNRLPPSVECQEIQSQNR